MNILTRNISIILWRLQEVSKHKHTNRQLIFQMEQKQNMKQRRIREKYFIDKWIGNYPGAKWRLELMLSLRLLIVDIVEYFILTNLHPKLLFAVRRSQVPRTRLNYKNVCGSSVGHRTLLTWSHDHISRAWCPPQTQILDPREIFSFSSLHHVTTQAVTSVSQELGSGSLCVYFEKRVKN